MKIIDLRCALFGNSPVIRIVTDGGLDGYGQIEFSKPYMTQVVPLYRDLIVGEDPTDIERCMIKIRRFAGFKPWGSAASAIEIALYDLTGKAYGIPVHKLLGGKVRDRVRAYNGGVREKLVGYDPADYASSIELMRAADEGFTIVKEGLGYHGFMAQNVPGFMLADQRSGTTHPAGDRSHSIEAHSRSGG